MGRRGPKPEPAAVKVAKGNPGRRPIGTDASVASSPIEAAAMVSPPSWLEDGKGLEVWKRLAPRLAQMKLLGSIDVETFGRYCRNFSRWLKMQERLDKVGEIYEIETASGLVRRVDPSFLVADRLERSLVAAEACFGLNPAERQRIFAARAATGATGDLFDPPTTEGQKATGERPSMAAPAQKRGSAIGILN